MSSRVDAEGRAYGQDSEVRLYAHYNGLVIRKEA